MTLTGLRTAPPRLVATDLDGTFLDDAERVPLRLRRAVTRLDAAGVQLVLATGRPARWVLPVVEQLTVRPLCLCGNGAVLFDSSTSRIVDIRTIDSQTQHFVVMVARAALGEVGTAVERPDNFVVSDEFVHAWSSIEHAVQGEDVVLSQPAVKLLLRNHTLGSREMYDIVRPHIPEERAHITFSIDEGLLEVGPPGVNKAEGVARVAEQLEVQREDVLCFGDMPNDSEMLSWAGIGVAMGNARPEVKAVADYVTATNNDCGVADVLEYWF